MVGTPIGGNADERVDDRGFATFGSKCVEHHRAHHAFRQLCAGCRVAGTQKATDQGFRDIRTPQELVCDGAFDVHERSDDFNRQAALVEEGNRHSTSPKASA